MHCVHCNSTKVVSNGGRYNSKQGLKSRWRCLDCLETFTVLENEKNITKVKGTKNLVITSAINNANINEEFFESLKVYCRENNADLRIIPVRHKNVGEAYIDTFHPDIQDYLLRENLEYSDYQFKIFGSLKLSATLENPLSGLDPMTKGDTLVIGHPQVQLKTLPRFNDTYPPILTTTGTISIEPYSTTKPGIKAIFNHSYSALVVEFDEVKGDKFVHVRHLNFDNKLKSFYDLDKLYDKNGSYKTNVIQTLITGDEHAIFTDESVKKATYTNKDSIVSLLKPEYIIRHDVLDCHSISHHDKKNFFRRYKKHHEQKHFIENELDMTVEYLNETTPEYSTSIIIASNHNEHLERWLNECDPKEEPWNAKIYHKIMYEILLRIENREEYDPFAIYAENKIKENIQFFSRSNNLIIDDILLSAHGDMGANGSRGSRDQFSLLPEKTIIGHSHSPGIEKGCYQVGTSSKLRLDYNIGSPSSWHHCHCIVYPNGKRQLLFITHGKYRKN